MERARAAKNGHLPSLAESRPAAEEEMPTCSVPSALPEQEANDWHVKERPDCQAKEDAQEEVESCTHNITEALVSHHPPVQGHMLPLPPSWQGRFLPDLGLKTLNHPRLQSADKILWRMVSKLIQTQPGGSRSIRAPSQHHSL